MNLKVLTKQITKQIKVGNEYTIMTFIVSPVYITLHNVLLCMYVYVHVLALMHCKGSDMICIFYQI